MESDRLLLCEGVVHGCDVYIFVEFVSCHPRLL